MGVWSSPIIACWGYDVWGDQRFTGAWCKWSGFGAFAPSAILPGYIIMCTDPVPFLRDCRGHECYRGIGNHEARVLEKANILYRHCFRCALLPRFACGFPLLMWTRDTGLRLPGNCLIEKRAVWQKKPPCWYLELYGIRLRDFLGKKWTVIGPLFDICRQICLYIHWQKIYMQSNEVTRIEKM